MSALDYMCKISHTNLKDESTMTMTHFEEKVPEVTLTYKNKANIEEEEDTLENSIGRKISALQ